MSPSREEASSYPRRIHAHRLHVQHPPLTSGGQSRCFVFRPQPSLRATTTSVFWKHPVPVVQRRHAQTGWSPDLSRPRSRSANPVRGGPGAAAASCCQELAPGSRSRGVAQRFISVPSLSALHFCAVSLSASFLCRVSSSACLLSCLVCSSPSRTNGYNGIQGLLL